MKTISLQMIYNKVTSLWWREVVSHFVKEGDRFEIRCWKEETDEIGEASKYGCPTDDGNEVSVKGIVSNNMIAELLSDDPKDKSIYNKMTKHFTINVYSEKAFFCSAHYGTEIYIEGISDEDVLLFLNIIEKYNEDDYFSINIK